jgi:hypothetical protein
MNKLLLAAVLGLVPLLSFGQGTAIRSLNGLGTNLTVHSTGTIALTVIGNQTNSGTIRSTTNFVSTVQSPGSDLNIIGSGAVLRIGTSGGQLTAIGGFSLDGILSGNGAGLTNLSSADFPAGPTYIYQGKVTFNSNVVVQVIDYTTNSHPSSGNIDLAKSFAAFATNNNTTFSGLANKNAGATNVQIMSLFITNTAAAARSIIMDASFQRMGSTDGNTLWHTNVGQLLVFHYPGFGTNYYFKSR